MRYQTKPIYYVNLSDEEVPQDHEVLLDDHSVLHLDQPADQKRLIDLRVDGLNGPAIPESCWRLTANFPATAPYFGIMPRVLDQTRTYPLTNEHLDIAYQDYKKLRELFNQPVMSYADFVKQHSHFATGIVAKKLNDTTIVSLLNTDNVSDLITALNIFETFDFDAQKINITVVFDTKEPLTKQQLETVASDIDGQMSDGWGETYGIKHNDFIGAVDGWSFSTVAPDLIIPSQHILYLPIKINYRGEYDDPINPASSLS